VTRVRLLPVVILAVAALLVLKTIGLVSNGGYVLTGVAVARAAGGGEAPAEAEGGHGGEATETVPHEPTMEDASPTLSDPAPVLGGEEDAGGHGEAPAPADATDHAEAPAPATSSSYCIEADATLTEEALPEGEAEGAGGHAEPAGESASDHSEEGSASDHEQTAQAPAEPDPAAFAHSMSVDCLPSGDVVPMQLGDGGMVEPLINADGSTDTEQQLLERLAARRTELEKYEQDLAMRSSLVDAAEKRIEERQATLEALEAQISTLVDQRKEMETGQFAGIVAMYEAMKPKDAANIFNNLEMPVLLRVAKTMQPRKMAPILAEMEPSRAQELTVQMADLADRPPEQMTPDDLAALPQIVGQ
jgi:flagellar motility protein MotE (MotC chaperone)